MSKDPFLIYQDDPSALKVSHHSRSSWAEEVFVFDVNTGKQVATPTGISHVGKSIHQYIGQFFFILLLILFGIIVLRVGYLQLIEGGSYLARAERNRQNTIAIPSERGIIYDRNGIQLTNNIPNFSLALIPQELPPAKRNGEPNPHREAVIDRLALITGEPAEDIRTTLNKYGAYSLNSIIIKEDVDYDTALAIQIAGSDLPGLHIVRGSKRLYLNTVAFEDSESGTTSTTPVLSLSHVLGYEGKLSPEELVEFKPKGYLTSDSIGKTGVEKMYESYMRGVYGKRQIEVDTYGREQTVLSEEAPQPGEHVRLAVDARLQAKLESLMNSILKKHEKVSGSAVVSNPQTGEILALVSLPAFDNNDFSGRIDKETYASYLENPGRPLFNRAIGGAFPSGSVIKPAIAAAALEEGIITPQTTFLSRGGLGIGPWFFPDWQAGGHGVTNVRKSIAQSVNTFYYYIGGGYGDFEGLGVDKIHSYLTRFGFSKRIGIDLPGETNGFIPSKSWKQEKKGESWYIGDTYNLSIGQGDLLVTPLQINMMTAAIANGGSLYKPHVVKSIIDPETKEEQDIPTEEVLQLPVSKNHLETIRLGMRDCVTTGSCRQLASLPFAAAGKTGTAQWNVNKDNHAWFTSFAPYDNPEIAITVLIEEGEEGSRLAVPVAYDLYRWWWQNR